MFYPKILSRGHHRVMWPNLQLNLSWRISQQMKLRNLSWLKHWNQSTILLTKYHTIIFSRRVNSSITRKRISILWCVNLIEWRDTWKLINHGRNHNFWKVIRIRALVLRKDESSIWRIVSNIRNNVNKKRVSSIKT